ncbi:MFS transporter [Photobacterium salinisoli]|uniref:MFS transporter n=1 Tax=Photobacterium salinisoli TaxID=1616783 RepID=UPI000EA290B2|nr:MFS transporter [Photobacterium salinisoli]
MSHITATRQSGGIFVPVAGLAIFAIASGYLMSLIPLTLSFFSLPASLASWLASTFYLGLLIGALLVEKVVARVGHRIAFVSFLALLAVTIVIMPIVPEQLTWLIARFIAGIAVAGIFVVVESWLLIGDNKKERAKRLGLYMTALYGGGTLGQFGIGFIGVEGLLPFVSILVLIALATLPALACKQSQPACEQHISLSARQVFALSKPAVLGCFVSGFVMSSLYGLLPISLQMQNLTAEQIGGLMASTVLGGMAIQPVVSALSCKMSKTLLMAAACLLGIFATGLMSLIPGYSIMVVGLALLGMSSFALYPIAISLACDELDSSVIVSATQIMLFSYSFGSVAGPLVAGTFLEQEHGLNNFFFVALASTAVYMLIVSMKQKPQIVAG